MNIKASVLSVITVIFCFGYVGNVYSADIIPLAERFKINSEILGEERSYLVWTPEGYSPSKAYPALYLLDGADHLVYISGLVEYLQFNNRIPAMLIVAIENTNRQRDLTPSPQGANSGGAKFLTFIEKELVPDIESQFNTRPYRLLVGHSAGATFTVYSLLTRPKLFNAYIGFSPLLNWNGNALLNLAESKLNELSALPIDLYYSTGNEEEEGISSAQQLATILEKGLRRNSQSNLSAFKWHYQHYPEETHMSTGMPTLNDGFASIFTGWYIKDPLEMYRNGGFAALDNNYKKISERLGYEVTIPYYMLWELKQTLLQHEHFDDAIAVMNKAVGIYPEEKYVRLELAKTYITAKDSKNAIKQLKILLELFPDFSQAKHLLETLE